MRLSLAFWLAAAFAGLDLLYRVILSIEAGRFDLLGTVWWVILVFVSWYCIFGIGLWLGKALISTLAKVFSRSRVSSKDDRTEP